MGYLTTITIYNDAASLISKNKKQVAEVLDKACSGLQLDQGYDYDSLGNHANAFILQKPRHADDTTLYMHFDNTVVCLDELETSYMKDAAINLLEFYLEKLKKKKILDFSSPEDEDWDDGWK